MNAPHTQDAALTALTVAIRLDDIVAIRTFVRACDVANVTIPDNVRAQADDLMAADRRQTVDAVYADEIRTRQIARSAAALVYGQ